jgi:hypothetical protein
MKALPPNQGAQVEKYGLSCRVLTEDKINGEIQLCNEKMPLPFSTETAVCKCLENVSGTEGIVRSTPI